MGGKLYIGIFITLCFAWNTHAAVNCTAAGRFADTSDTTCKNYTLCVASSDSTYTAYDYECPSTSLFNPTTALCTTDYTCNTTNTTTNTTSSVCTAEGFVADPDSTNCTTYIQCILENGTYTEYDLTCPNDTYYNPNTTLCEEDYNCTSTTTNTTTTTFTCTAAGRFENPSDTTCQTYYLCVLSSDGTYTQYEYTCPSTSLFNPSTSVCTTTYTCTTT